METNETPYQNLSAQFRGLGTATAPESIDLAEDIPVATNFNEVNREATRYLVFAGDKLVPSQKRERPDLRTGGEYFGQGFKTLIRSKGLVRRCQITPLEVGFDFMSNDMVGDDANLHVVTTVNHNDPNRGGMQAHTVGPLNGIKVYPGDEIKGILQGERNNTSSGIVEIKQLAGVEYADFRASGLQEFIFPEWAKIVAGIGVLPNKISALQAHLTERKNATSDQDIKSVIEVYEASCDQYRTWGMNYLKFSSQLVRLPAHQGFVHTYSELAEMLFEQLEVRREDMMSSEKELAEIIAKASSGNGISSAETNVILERLAANQELLTQFLVNQNPPVETVPDTVKCTGMKANGDACGASPIEGSDRCRHHQNDTIQ